MVTISTSKGKYTGPYTWKEVTTRVYGRMQGRDGNFDKDDPIALGARIYNMPVDVVTTLRGDGIRKMVDAMQFAYLDPALDKLPVPTHMHLAGKMIPIVRNVKQAIVFGQAVQLRKIIEKGQDFTHMAKVLAIYAQPLIDNAVFNSARVDELTEQFEELPIHMVYPVSFFLLGKFRKRGTITGNVLDQIPRASLWTLRRLRNLPTLGDFKNLGT